MQELGFTLRELTRFIRSLEAEPQNYPERRACVEAKLDGIDEQIERLRSMRDELSTRLQTCKCCNAPSEEPPIEQKAPYQKERRCQKE